jgi:hypothetical protein
MSGRPHGTIHGEEAQSGGRQLEEVAVGVRHQLVGLLGRGVEADRVVDVVVLRVGHALVAAVDAGTAGIHEVLDAVVATALEEVHETDHIAVDVGMRILQRVAHTGLGRQIDDPLRPLGGEQGGDAVAVGDVEPGKPEARIGRQARQARFLQRHVVVVVEVVDPDHFVAARQQTLADMHADKSGGAGNQNFHWALL